MRALWFRCPLLSRNFAGMRPGKMERPVVCRAEGQHINMIEDQDLIHAWIERRWPALAAHTSSVQFGSRIQHGVLGASGENSRVPHFAGPSPKPDFLTKALSSAETWRL